MINSLVKTKEKTAMTELEQRTVKKKGPMNSRPGGQHRNRGRRVSMVKDVKRTIELALQESNWAKTSSQAKGIKVFERKTIRGDSGLSWTPDLIVSGKSASDVCLAAFCIDTDHQRRIEGAFDRALAACLDLDYIASIRAVIVNDYNYSYRSAVRKLVSRYKSLFASNGDDIKVIDCVPTNICDLVLQILAELRGIYPNRRGIRKIDDTVHSLAQAHPDIFGEYFTQTSQKTIVVDLLQKIKNSDPSQSFAKIISRAIADKDVCGITLPFRLHRMSDKDFEGLLKDYLALQK